MQDTSSTPVAPDDLAAALATSEQARLRLAEELARSEARVGELGERLYAVGEMLKAISRSTFDLAEVLGVLAEHATRLSDSEWALVYRYDG